MKLIQFNKPDINIEFYDYDKKKIKIAKSKHYTLSQLHNITQANSFCL